MLEFIWANSKSMKLWIARDKNNDLYLYNRLPSLGYYGTSFDADSDEYLALDENLFPEVTFENSPQMIELKLVK